MKIDAYDINNKKIKLEVFKVQIALFGGPAALIYNETRDIMYETTDKNEVREIRKLIKKEKAFVAGEYVKKTGKVILMHVLPDTNLF